MQLFSEWLERLQQRVDFTDKGWLLAVAVETVKREPPVPDWQEVEACGIRRVQLLRNLDTDWRVAGARLYVSPRLYGNILMVQHLLSRAQQHGGQTFEGRLTLAEFTNRLRRVGYLETLGITTPQPFEIFEQAIAALVASGPTAVYYAIDRRQYLERLQQLYRKNFATSKES